jgi:NAD(P)-dependent dehydrogenase (short-subunit alcohol dehydrogenase family)
VGDFSGRIVLVSGVARPPGIGRATALRLASAGATVACADVVGEQASDTRDTAVVPLALFDQVVAEVRAAAAGGGGDVLRLPHDDAPESWHGLVDATVGAFGQLDTCCALNGVTGAAAGDGPLVDVAEDAWRRSMELNLTGAWLLSRAAARAMITAGHGGCIVHLSSQAGLVAKAGVGAVGAARAAVNHLVAVLARELGGFGIRCNAVAPLCVEPTALFPNPGLIALAERESGSFAEWVRDQIPLGRAQSADETAAVISFLCSRDASYISGVTIPVCGGAAS